jgi:YD repeat-containing protein
MKSTNLWAVAFTVGLALFTQGCKKDEVKSSASGCYVLTQQSSGSDGSSNTTFTYSSSNVLTSITLSFTGFGSTTYTLSYDSQGRLTKVTFSDNSYITNTYDSNGHLTESDNTDSKGNQNSKTTYTYNSSGQVTLVQFYGQVNGTGPLTLSSHDTYDYASTSTKNPQTASHYVDDSGSQLMTTDTFEYDSNKVPTASQTSDPTQSTNNVTKITTKGSGGDVENTTTYSYQYNSEGYPTTVTMNSTGNSNGLSAQNSTTTYTYNCK